MRNFIYLSVTLFTLTIIVAFSKEIKSTKKGGDWHSKKTWVGGKIPLRNDDVVIFGKVTCMKGFICENLKVEKDGSLLMNTGDSVVCGVLKKFVLYGCFEIAETTVFKIKGSFDKQSECFQNSGMLEVGM